MIFESMNSASILLMLGFAAIMVMFFFVMRSLDSLVKSLREERRSLISSLDNLSQDIRSIKINLSQGSSGNQAATAKPAPANSQFSHNMAGTAPAPRQAAPASGQGLFSPGPGNPPASPLSSPAIALSPEPLPGIARHNATPPASPLTIGASKASKDDFFLDLSPKDSIAPKQNHSTRAKQSGLELKL